LQLEQPPGQITHAIPASTLVGMGARVGGDGLDALASTPLAATPPASRPGALAPASCGCVLTAPDRPPPAHAQSVPSTSNQRCLLRTPRRPPSLNVAEMVGLRHG
jgi:hypothetical protein